MNLELQRERTIQALCAHFAHDRLSLEEVDRRLEQAQRARSEVELRALLADLPAPVPATRSGEIALFSLAEPGEAPSERRLLAVLGEVKREGVWTPARRQRVVVVLGEAKLDFREARLQPGVTEVDCSVVLGQLTLLVPTGVRVECEGSAILGSFEGGGVEAATALPDAPVVRVTGMSFLGEVAVKVRLPGESALQSLKRRWKEELFGE